MYDFRENKWHVKENIPSERVFVGYCTDNEQRIYSCGGLNKDAREGMSDSMEYFDITAGSNLLCLILMRNLRLYSSTQLSLSVVVLDKWMVNCAPMPTKRGDFAMGVMNNVVVCAGGLGKTSKFSVIQSVNGFARFRICIFDRHARQAPGHDGGVRLQD